MMTRHRLAGLLLAVLATACVGPSRFFDLESPSQTVAKTRLSDGPQATVEITSSPSGALIEVLGKNGDWRTIGNTPRDHGWPTRQKKPGPSVSQVVEVRWVYRGNGEWPAEQVAKKGAESAIDWGGAERAPSVRSEEGGKPHSLAKVRKFPTVPLLGIPIPDFIWVNDSGFQYRYAGLESLPESEPETVSYPVKVRASKEGHHPQLKTITIPDTEAVHFELTRIAREERYTSTLRFLTTPPESVVGVAAPVRPRGRTPRLSTWSQPRVEEASGFLGDGGPAVALDPLVTYGTRSDGFWATEGFENLPLAGRGLQFVHEPGPREFSWDVYQGLDGLTQALDSSYSIDWGTPIEYWVQARGHWPKRGFTSLARGVPEGALEIVEVELVPMKRRRIGAKSIVWLRRDGESGIREELEWLMERFQGLEALDAAPFAADVQELGIKLITSARDALDNFSTARSGYPADLVTGALVGQPFLQVLERQQVDRFFHERELSEAEIYDADQRPVFEQLAVEYLVLGTCSTGSDGRILSLRAVEVLTGEVIASAHAEAPSIEKAVGAAVRQLTQRMAVLFRAQDG